MSFCRLATAAGLEPATPSFEGWCSIRLSYAAELFVIGAPLVRCGDDTSGAPAPISGGLLRVLRALKRKSGQRCRAFRVDRTASLTAAALGSGDHSTAAKRSLIPFYKARTRRGARERGRADLGWTGGPARAAEP